MTKENIKKYGLIYFLILVVLVLSVTKVKYGYKGGDITPILTVVPTETVVPTPTEATSAAEVLKVDVTKYPLWNQVPYSGDGFLIDRYVAPKVLGIQLEGASTSSAAKAVNTWLKTFGEVGKGHKIEFE